MKAILLTAVLSLGVAANAQSAVKLSERTVMLNVDISQTQIRLSGADYPVPVVKVLVPELADVTILNHRNTGEGAPCLATFETVFPEQVVQNRPEVERIPFKVSLEKLLVADEANHTCHVTMAERVHAVIRGFNFSHERFIKIGDRHIDDCR